jgi:hypothetical protein
MRTPSRSKSPNSTVSAAAPAISAMMRKVCARGRFDDACGTTARQPQLPGDDAVCRFVHRDPPSALDHSRCPRDSL